VGGRGVLRAHDHGKGPAWGGRGGGQRKARGGGQRRRERERRERRKKNGRKLYFLTLPSARDPALGKGFLKILKYSLLSARSRALGKDDFAECRNEDTRQRSFNYSLPSAHQLALDKACFAECHLWTLGELLFFIFPTKFFVVCYYTI
jgi:hypothetical protein